MKKILFVLALVLLCSVSLVACSKDNQTEVSKKTQAVVKFNIGDKDKVIYDGEDITITYVDSKEDEYEYILSFKYENKTDKEYDIQLRNKKINEKDLDIIIYSDVAKPNATDSGNGLSVSKSGLKENSIEKLEQIGGNIVVLYDITEEVANIPVNISFK